MANLLVINGPNLNLLGTREPDVYGTTTLAELEEACRQWGTEAGYAVETLQSNHEGALIDAIHAARGTIDGIVFNPGAYTHTSYALHDAIAGVDIPTVEVHISNVFEREPWRATSVVRPACVHGIYGRGIDGYRWAIRHLAARLVRPPETIAYGPVGDQIADLRVPDGEGPHPVAVLLHGGFWRRHWTRDLMDGLAVDLTDRGWATWNVEYRRVGTGGGWPITAFDVAHAIDHVSQLDAYLDLDCVVVIGHSAGGHLALWSAARRAQPSGTIGSDPLVVPRLAVGLAAVSDLRTGHGLGDGAVDAFLADAVSHSDLYRAASPIDAIPLSVPTLLVHGTDDEAVPIDQSREFAAAAREAGDDTDLVVLDGVGHMELIDPAHEAWTAVTDRLANLC